MKHFIITYINDNFISTLLHKENIYAYNVRNFLVDFSPKFLILITCHSIMYANNSHVYVIIRNFMRLLSFLSDILSVISNCLFIYCIDLNISSMQLLIVNYFYN